jgi:hypothetical protein
MDDYLELLKVEQALRSENMKLDYRRRNKPNDVNILDYTIIAALEKQIPKKIKSDCGNYYCPICNKNAMLYSGEKLEFCKSCGQKLDWENIFKKNILW